MIGYAPNIHNYQLLRTKSLAQIFVGLQTMNYLQSTKTRASYGLGHIFYEYHQQLTKFKENACKTLSEDPRLFNCVYKHRIEIRRNDRLSAAQYRLCEELDSGLVDGLFEYLKQIFYEYNPLRISKRRLFRNV